MTSKFRLVIVLSCIFLLSGAAGPGISDVKAQNASEELAGPGSVTQTLAEDDREKSDFSGEEENGVDAFKDRIKKETGLDFGLDYNSLGFAASRSPGEHTAASGAFRVYGAWELLRRGTPNNGSLIFKVENRHAYTVIAPTDFGNELGYAGLMSSVFSDQGWRTTQLFWQQRFADGRGVSYTGFLDVTDYVDVYALASPWSGFSNLAFQTGTGTIGGLPDGAFGTMLGGFLTTNVYAVAGIADANAEPTNVFSGFSTFFEDFETFKSFELGWTTDQDSLFVNNAHITFWQIDERQAVGTPDGWGVSFSLSARVADYWLPFLRGGWSEDGTSLYSAAISAGFGYTTEPGKYLLGVGFNWSRPSESTFGTKLDDQFAAELFKQLQVTERIELTPSLQYIINPALNTEDNSTLVVGLRLRGAL